MKMRRRHAKPLNLSVALAQSDWAGDLHRPPASTPDPVEPRPAAAHAHFAASNAADAAFLDDPDDDPSVPEALFADTIPELPPAPEPIVAPIQAPRERDGKKAKVERVKAEKAKAEKAAKLRNAKAPRAKPQAAKGPGQTRSDRPDLGSARYAYVIALLAGVVWAASFIAFVLGFERNVPPLTYAPFQAVILALLTVLPTAFMLLAAFAMRQGARLAFETRRARELAEDLLEPAALAAAQTGDIVERVRQEVERAAESSRAAGLHLTALRETLAQETDRLTEAAGEAQRTTRAIGDTLGRERDEVTALNQSLKAHSGELAESVRQQTRLVAEASDLARTQLQEAEAALAVRAADITQATATAGATARDAGDHLGRQTDRLDTVAAALVERLGRLDERLAGQRNGLAALLDSCGDEQDDIAARLESRRAQLVEVIAQCRIEAEELGQTSSQSAETLRRLIAEASEQMRALAEAADARQEALTTRAATLRSDVEQDLQRAIAALGETARDAYAGVEDHADQVRRAASTHVEAARTEVEQLGELAFDAGQRANKAFDARIGEARRLIEQSAAMIEEAGTRSAERIEAGLDATRAAIGELANALIDIDARMARLPEDARARVDSVRSAVERGIGEFTTAARKVAEETQAIDAAFQERVRRNYETLSEAARLMSRAADAPPRAEAPPAPASAPDSTQPAQAAPRPATALAPSPAAPAATAAPARRPGGFAGDDDFVPPETVFRREPSAPRTAASALPPPLDRRPGFSGGRAGAIPGGGTPVFGRASSRPEREDELVASEPAPPAAPPPTARADRTADRDPDRGAEDMFAPNGHDRAPPPAPAPATGYSPEDPGSLRPRLRLTPTEADVALKTVFDPLQARNRDEAARESDRPSARPWEGEMDEWTWKDLLSSIDEAPADDDALAEQLIGEIAALGVDANALLPPSRVDEISASIRAGDTLAARDSVRRLAPAAIRRLSRRVLTDSTLREQANRYVLRYQGLLRGSAERDGVTSTLLSSDPGRAYLLLDAAVGDLQ